MIQDVCVQLNGGEDEFLSYKWALASFLPFCALSMLVIWFGVGVQPVESGKRLFRKSAVRSFRLEDEAQESVLLVDSGSDSAHEIV